MVVGWMRRKQAGQKGQSQENQGDMAIPAHTRAYFVVIQTQFFGSGEVFFNAPTRSQRLHDLAQRSRWGSPDEVKCVIGIGAGSAADEQTMPAIVAALMPNGETNPLKEAWSFGALTHGKGLPSVRGKKLRQFAHFPATNAKTGNLKDDGFGARHSHHVGLVATFQPGTQLRVGAIDAIGDHPVHLDVCLFQPLQEANGQVGFGLKRVRLRNASGVAASGIGGPILGEVQLAVHQGMSGGGHEGKKDANLAIADIARGAAILLAHAQRSACRV